jgi:hypothetical protein
MQLLILKVYPKPKPTTAKSYNHKQTTSKRGKKVQLKDENMLAIGMISLALGLLIGRFVNFEYLGISVSAFVEGVLIGLSLVMNLAYLVSKRKK